MKRLPSCPACHDGGVRKTHTRDVGSFIEARRRCNRCPYRDIVLIRPEVIVSTRPLVCEHTSAPTAAAPLAIELNA
jgi:hypothetical protein